MHCDLQDCLKLKFSFHAEYFQTETNSKASKEPYEYRKRTINAPLYYAPLSNKSRPSLSQNFK